MDKNCLMAKFKVTININILILLLCSIVGGLDICKNHQCENLGTCKPNEGGGYNCHCINGYTGKFCQIKPNENPCKNGASYGKVDGNFKCQCLNGWSGEFCELNTDDCASKPCKNGGICKDLDNHKYECNCPKDYFGMNCEFHNPCAEPHPCGVNGDCVAQNFNEHSCVCKKGYTGNTCSVDIDECANYDTPLCENGGICKNSIGSYSCECKKGFTGERCEMDIVDCLNDTCKNGGTCLDKIGSYKCICTKNFKGDNCEIPISVCERMPCKNGGNCRDYGNGFYCICPDRWKGETCEEEKNPCSNNPCLNDGQCQKLNYKHFKCVCRPGFSGNNCEVNVNECAHISCLNGGTCTDLVNQWKCNCLSGYKGSYCETKVNKCESNPCLNNGKCINQGDSYRCLCPDGLGGHNCEINIDECSLNSCFNGGRCEDRVGGYTCHCLDGFVGLQCETKSDVCKQFKPCKNSEICQNDPTTYLGYKCTCPVGNRECQKELSKCKKLDCKNGNCVEIFKQEKCICSPGFTGNQCDIEINQCLNNPCQHGGTCQNLVNAYQCICPGGYKGKNCETNIDDCANNPCGANGNCRDEVNGFRCECYLPYSGPNCKIKLNPCKLNKCSNDALCIPNKDYRSYHCDCSTAIGRFEGTYCEIDINECLLNKTELAKYNLALDMMPDSQLGPCVNDKSQCINTSGSFICKCSREYEGKQCELTVDNCRENPCRHGGFCDSLPDGFRCRCAAGFQGELCEKEIDECEGNLCQNNATCYDHINNYHCVCPSGFSGKNCQTNDNDCTESSCSKHGKCVDQVNGFVCKCFENYTGTNCEHLKRPCDGRPCLNNGSCTNRKTINDKSGYLCSCRRGYTGSRCEIKMDWCRGSPCGENGICVTNSDSFKCVCNSEYIGERCEIKKGMTCASHALARNPVCMRHGTCVDDPDVGGLKCICPSGYSGTYCEINIDDCANQPCLNGGECVDGIGMYSCKCQPGFQGVNCQANTNDCTPNTCNGGKCIDLINSFKCICPRGLSGTLCEIEEDYCKNTSCLNGGSCKSLVGDFSCQCVKGFTGKLCEIDINECKYNLDGSITEYLKGPCSPVGTLECLDKPGKFVCVCKTGFTGKFCNLRLDHCEEARKSGKDPCFNFGLCENVYDNKNSSYKCNCQSGYGGDRCQLYNAKCELNVCKNGGICRPLANGEKMSFECKCPPGVGGQYCEVDFVDECQTTLCYSGGQCENGFGKAICRCPEGTCGERCEISGSACSLQMIENSQTFNEELKQCQIDQCPSKAGNKFCDMECNKLACGFDGSECLHRVPKRINNDDVSMAFPWSNCSIIKTDNIPCHNWFNNKRCDPQCNTEECLFDGWDCMNFIGQCSEKAYCDKHYGDGICQVDCNNMECNFDGGDCLEFRNTTIPGGIILLLPVSTTEFVARWLTKLLQSLTTLLHSVVRVKNDEDGKPMIYSIRVFAETSNMERKIRKIRSLNSIQKGKPGTKVYLEVDSKDCKIISKLCFDNSKSVAEFVTAALYSKFYQPPVPILSVQTFYRRRKDNDVTPNRIVYILVVMICLVVLGVLVGVLYGFMQNKSQTNDKKIKKAEIWYPDGMKRLNQPTSQFHHRRLGNSNRKRNQNLLNCHNTSSELGNLQNMTKSKISTTDSIDDSGSNSLTSTRVTSYEININESNNENVMVSENCMLLSSTDLNLNFPPEKRLKLHMDNEKDYDETKNIESWCFNAIVQLLISGNGLGEFSSTESRDKQIIVEKLLQIAVNNQDDGKKFADFSNKNDLSKNSIITILNARIPHSGETLLHLASKFNRLEAAKFLLEAGSDPNKLEMNGRSCLMTAIDAGALEIVVYLLEQQTFNLDLHQKGPGGTTCLIQAVKEAHIEIIQLLLQHIQPEECDLNVTDDYGRTALHWAAITGQAGVVHLLLSYGLNRDAQDNEEATPLFLACKEGALEVCKILIGNGANPDMSDHLDRLPRDIAKSNNFDNVVALLDDYVNITKESQQHRSLMWGPYNCYANNYYCGNYPMDLKSALYSSPQSIQQMACCAYPSSIPQHNIDFKSKNIGFYNSTIPLQNQSNQTCFRANSINYMTPAPDSVKKRISHTSMNLQNPDSKLRYQITNKRNNMKSPNFIEYSSNSVDLPTVPPPVTNFYSCTSANNTYMALSAYNSNKNNNNNNNPTSSTSAHGITPSPDSDSPGHWSTSSSSLSPRSKNQQHLLMQNAQNVPNHGQNYTSSVLHYHPPQDNVVDLGPNSAVLQKNAMYILQSRDNICQY